MPKTGWMAWKPEEDGEFYWTRGPDEYFTLKNDFERTKHFLGNLVMTKHQFNVIYSNHPYKRLPTDPFQDAKKTLYSTYSDWSEVRAISTNYEDWNSNTIRDRQERMARWAVKRWKLECDTDNLEGELPAMQFIDEHSQEFKQIRQTQTTISHMTKVRLS